MELPSQALSHETAYMFTMNPFTVKLQYMNIAGDITSKLYFCALSLPFLFDPYFLYQASMMYLGSKTTICNCSWVKFAEPNKSS